MRLMKLVEEPSKVALITSTSITTLMEIQRGILNYVRENGPWRVQLIQGREDERVLSTKMLKDLDGAIVNASALTPSLLAALNAARVPTITIDGRLNSPSIVATIRCDNENVGRTAADWLVERGFKNFAYFGALQPMVWSQERQAAFSKHLSRLGFSCAVFEDGRDTSTLSSWLAELPKPVALFVANDIAAPSVVNACNDAKLSIPREVAILSVDNIDTLCESLTPALSSIQLTTEAVGYEAARFLDLQMRRPRRAKTKPKVFHYKFSHIVERQSSTRMLKFDPIVERAMNFIRLNYAQNFTIEDLVCKMHLSKRMLEMKFKRATGHSPYAELIRYRIEKARVQIMNTTKSLQTIATECGFASASHLSHSFQTVLHKTPGSFRK